MARYLFLYIGGGMPAHNGKPRCSFSGENSRAPVSPARAILPKLFTARFPSVCIGPLFRYLALERLPETCYGRRASSRSPLCGTGYPALVAHCASNDLVGGLDLWESKKQQPPSQVRRKFRSLVLKRAGRPTQISNGHAGTHTGRRFTQFFNFLCSCPIQFSFINITFDRCQSGQTRDLSYLFLKN